jgi:MFS transporter, DHA3 family, macrolide efflux protein
MNRNRQASKQTAPKGSLKTFFTIWVGQIASLLGSHLVSFALVWWLTETTNSATSLAIAATVSVLPGIVIAPIAGALIDRWDRRRVMIVADCLVALVTLGLAGLFTLDIVRPWHLYILMLLRATGGAFHWPAMQAATGQLIPKKHLSRISGLNQALQGAANIVVPPAGALILKLLPMQSILAIDVVTAVIAVLPLLFVRIPKPERPAKAPPLSTDLREGFRYVTQHRGIMLVILCSVFVNILMAPASSFIPLMVTRHFGGGVLELGWMQSALGFGIVAGGLLLGAWGGFRNRSVTAVVALFLRGIGMLIVGLTPSTAFPLALTAAFFYNAVSPLVDGSIMAILQSVVPNHLMGRVVTLVHSGFALSIPIGMAIGGPLADAAGVSACFIGAGVLTALTAIAAFANKEIMSMGREAMVSDMPALGQVSPAD